MTNLDKAKRIIINMVIKFFQEKRTNRFVVHVEDGIIWVRMDGAGPFLLRVSFYSEILKEAHRWTVGIVSLTDHETVEQCHLVVGNAQTFIDDALQFRLRGYDYA